MEDRKKQWWMLKIRDAFLRRIQMQKIEGRREVEKELTVAYLCKLKLSKEDFCVRRLTVL